MEIKYADNVTLTVEITDQMVKDFKRCQEMAEKANCDGMDCNSCSNNIDMDIKYCPDLTGYEEVKAAFVGHGDFTRPILRECIKEACAAYKEGYCEKYHNKVEDKP